MKLFHRSMHTYRAVFFLVVASLGFLCALLLYSSNKNAEETIYLENKRTLLSTAYTASIQGYRLSMEGMFRNMPAVLDLLAQGTDTQGEERDKASQELHRTLEGLQETLQHLHLQQIHYHLGDGSLFLSFPQSPEQSAARRSECLAGIELCNKERQVVHGVFAERFFTGVRYMLPLIRQGQHVGCVEADIAFNTILGELKTILPDQEYAYIIDKKRVDPQWLTEHTRLYTPSAIHDDYLAEDGSAHLHTSPPPLSSEAKRLNLLLKQEASVQEAMDQGTPVSVVLRLAGTPYTVSLLPLHGVDTQVYGYLIAYAPDPLLVSVQRTFYVTILTGTGAFILFLLLFFRLGRHVRALKDERRALSVLNETLSEGVCVHNSDGAIILVNPAACRILGQTEAELLGRTSRTLFGDNDVVEATETAHSDEDDRLNQYHGEQVVPYKDGGQGRVRVSYRPILKDGRMSGAITTLHDLTAQKQLEEELRRSEKNRREAARIIEQSPVSILITNTLGLIKYANAQLIQLSGYSMEEMRGRHFWMMTSEETPKSTRNAVWETVVLGRTWQGELIIRHKNGQTYRKLTFIAPIRDDAGTITHFIAIPENLPEHRRVEQENETISSALIENLPVGLVIIDEATRVIEEVNSMAATMFGAKRGAIVGARCRQFLCPTMPDPCPADARDFIRADSEEIILRADGSRIPILKTIRKITIRDRAKLLECFIDIHEQKQIEEALQAANHRLEEANRNKSSFLAHMSHEIRTPMNAIIGMTHLAMQTDDNEKRRHFLATVQDSAENLLGLLNDILDFSKMEVGQLQLNSTPFSPANLVDEVLASLRLLAEQKKLRLHAQIDESVPPCLQGDELRLRQIFTNLIGNAVKFTHEGSVTIRVRLEPEPDPGPDFLLHCVVSDTGIGIAADKQVSIFNSFEQADSGYARQQGGTGLGLSICRQLVTLMGGRIWVESTPGKGSDFYFLVRLEACTGSPQTLSPAASTSPPMQIAGLRILLVDDNEINRDVARLLLEEANHLVVTAENGLAALERLAEAEFDLVLMDVQMPILDGMTTTKIIRAVEAGNALMVELPGQQSARLVERLTGGHLRIIAMTAHAMSDARDLCLASGMDTCITKPFQPETLLQVLTSQHELEQNLVSSGTASPSMPPPSAPEAQDIEDIAEAGDEGPARPSLEQVIDHLRRTTPLTEEQVGQIIKAVQASVATNLDKAEQSLSAGDLDALGRAAHTLKGTLLQCGLREWADKAQQLHTGVKQKEQLPYAELLAELREGLQPLV